MTNFSIEPFFKSNLLTNILNEQDNITKIEFEIDSLGSLYEDNSIIIYWQSFGTFLIQPAFIIKQNILTNFNNNNIIRGGFQLANQSHNSLRHFALTKSELILSSELNPIWFSLVDGDSSEDPSETILGNSVNANGPTYQQDNFVYDTDYNFKANWNKAKVWLGDKDKKIPYYDIDIWSSGNKGYMIINKM